MRALTLVLALVLSACATTGPLALPSEGSAGSGMTVSSKARISARLKAQLAAQAAAEGKAAPEAARSTTPFAGAPTEITAEAPTEITAEDPTVEEPSGSGGEAVAEESPGEEAPAVEPRKPGKRRVAPYRLSLVRGKKRLDNVALIEVDPADPQRMWISKSGRKAVTDFLADEKHDLEKRVPERLLWYLYLVGQEFDSPIHILSAYRSKERQGSRHAHGKAVDFRIPGVDPKHIWNALKRFDAVGLGWYPKSKFVHLDVRERSAYWIDDSGPGQRARYRKHVPQDREKKRRMR